MRSTWVLIGALRCAGGGGATTADGHITATFTDILGANIEGDAFEAETWEGHSDDCIVDVGRCSSVSAYDNDQQTYLSIAFGGDPAPGLTHPVVTLGDDDPSTTDGWPTWIQLSDARPFGASTDTRYYWSGGGGTFTVLDVTGGVVTFEATDVLMEPDTQFTSTPTAVGTFYLNIEGKVIWDAGFN